MVPVEAATGLAIQIDAAAVGKSPASEGSAGAAVDEQGGREARRSKAGKFMALNTETYGSLADGLSLPGQPLLEHITREAQALARQASDGGALGGVRVSEGEEEREKSYTLEEYQGDQRFRRKARHGFKMMLQESNRESYYKDVVL